jgi:hypothetical protein
MCCLPLSFRHGFSQFPHVPLCIVGSFPASQTLSKRLSVAVVQQAVIELPHTMPYLA